MVNAATPDEAIETARSFTLKDVAKDIACPYLITHGGNDRVVPVENAPKLYEAVGTRNKTLKIFSTEEGGAEHAHVDNRQIGIDFAADWLERGVVSPSHARHSGRCEAPNPESRIGTESAGFRVRADARPGMTGTTTSPAAGTASPASRGCPCSR